MAKASSNNNWQGNRGFLSDIVKGTVAVDTPNRFMLPDEEWAGHQPASAERATGARSGTGKTLKVK